MITIKLNNVLATFSGEQWSNDNERVQEFLNNTFDINEFGPGVTYAISKYNKSVHGLDGAALDAIAILKPEIVGYIPDEIPEEQEGVVI